MDGCCVGPDTKGGGWGTLPPPPPPPEDPKILLQCVSESGAKGAGKILGSPWRGVNPLMTQTHRPLKESHERPGDHLSVPLTTAENPLLGAHGGQELHWLQHAQIEWASKFLPPINGPKAGQFSENTFLGPLHCTEPLILHKGTTKPGYGLQDSCRQHAVVQPNQSNEPV